MSLTRKQWDEMWESAERIQALTHGIISDSRKKAIQAEVKKIKELIQSVVGQLE